MSDIPTSSSPHSVPDPGPEPGEERRVHEREATAPRSLTIDLGFGPVAILDWSLGGARIKGAALALAVGDFANGEISLGTAKGPFIADIVRVEPPYLDPKRPPDEISLRWLDLPPEILRQMIAAKPAS